MIVWTIYQILIRIFIEKQLFLTSYTAYYWKSGFVLFSPRTISCQDGFLTNQKKREGKEKENHCISLVIQLSRNNQCSCNQTISIMQKQIISGSVLLIVMPIAYRFRICQFQCKIYSPYHFLSSRYLDQLECFLTYSNISLTVRLPEYSSTFRPPAKKERTLYSFSS